MLWARKGLVYFLSVLLFVCLLGVAVATSLNINLSHPARVEAWLKESKLYDHFVAEAIAHAHKSAGSQVDNGPVSLSDTAVQQAAESAFSPQLLEQSVHTVLASNYAWLQGETPTPNFKIDLTSAKQSFAEQVGLYVKSHLISLPACSPEQQSKIDVANLDPLTVVCRPDTTNPEFEAEKVTQNILSGNFLSNPVITPDSINPNETPDSQPYYTKLSFAPKFYSTFVKLPWALGLISLVLALSIIVVAPLRRKGWRQVGILLLSTGVILIISKFIADFLLRKVEDKAFNGTNVGQVEQSLSAFAHHAETELVKINLLFGICFVLLAIVVFVMLRKSRVDDEEVKTPPKPKPATVKNTVPPPSSGKLSRLSLPKNLGSKMPSRPTKKPGKPKSTKPPRLVQ